MADLLSEQRERLFRLQEALEEAYPGLYHRTKAQVEVMRSVLDLGRTSSS